MLDVLLANHVKVDHGKLIMVDGSPLIDDKPVLEAADRLFKVWDQRAKLTGSYAPTEVKVEHNVQSDLDREIEQLMAGMGRVGEGSAAMEAASEADPTHP